MGNQWGEGVTPNLSAGRFECDARRFSLHRVLHFEKLPRGELKHPGDHIRWDLGDLGVVVAHHRIVVTPCVLDSLLDPVETRVELGEALDYIRELATTFG